MKWSWRMTRIAGIDVYVHATFLILLAWIALTYWLVAGTLSAVINGVAFILALFACVVLHELGHALTARRFGIKTRDITLLPIGGVAALERMPSDPRQEILVALAGPAVNVVIAALLWGWLWLADGWVPAERLTVTGGPFLERLMVVNLFLALFNLLPAFPMDGGRVLRAWLAMRMDYNVATRTAASIGQGLAFGLGLLGLLYNPFLLFIALFVWIGAASEAAMTQVQAVLSGVKVGQAMQTRFETLSPSDSLERAVELTLTGSQKDFLVAEGDTVVGVLTHADLLKGLQRLGDHGRVGEVMEREFQTVQADEPLDKVLQRLQGCNCRLVPVMRAGRLVGVVNLDNILEYVQMQAALHSGDARGGFGA